MAARLGTVCVLWGLFFGKVIHSYAAAAVMGGEEAAVIIKQEHRKHI